jgi:hypothetical protein
LVYELTEIDSWCFLGFKKTWMTRIAGFWHNPGLPMTKTELQSGVFLDTLSDIATKRLRRTANLSYPVLASS